ncbi:MAG: symmetrical bis(5'-nucleosyl)-tetraphosphatase [Gammaproteobacteria bacterium]
MLTYAIGDVQGCYGELRFLLDRIGFDPGTARLWLTGDLVNRGPRSLEVLRFVKGLGEAALTVLGNHDLHLLAVAEGQARPNKLDNGKDRTGALEPVLAAKDRDELLDWLRRRPLMHHDPALGYALVHAGLPPEWDVAEACRCAAEVEASLRGDGFREFLGRMYGDAPRRWSERLAGWDRLRFITNCLTRLRYCGADGTLALEEKGPPSHSTAELIPWFQVPGRASDGMGIVFGHWSTLRMDSEAMARYRVYPLDTGCCWGGRLTALELDTGRFQSVPCRPSD